MASSKISNLPSSSPTSLPGNFLLAVVDVGGNITQKATVSQLPLGISTVNNLGGGSTLGLISGSELRLKTLISGTGLSFTTTTNTITLNTILNISSVGSGSSLINSFSNPNLSVKSITGSAGINITDNTTSINISNAIDTSKDSIIGLMEVPSVKEYVLESYINKPYTINNLYLLTSSGSATVRLKSRTSSSVDVITGSTFTANGIRSTNLISSFTTTLGQQLVFEVVSNNTALNLSFTIDLTYI